MPHRDKPAYDMIVKAMSGGMSMTGEPGRPAVRVGIPLGDIAAGIYAVIACLAALHRRTGTGASERIDVSMLACQLAMTSYQSAYWLHSGAVPGRQGRGHDPIPTYRASPRETARRLSSPPTPSGCGAHSAGCSACRGSPRSRRCCTGSAKPA